MRRRNLDIHIAIAGGDTSADAVVGPIVSLRIHAERLRFDSQSEY